MSLLLHRLVEKLNETTHVKHLAEGLVLGRNPVDVTSDADTDDWDGGGGEGGNDADEGDRDSCEGSSHSLDTHCGPPLCLSIYFHSFRLNPPNTEIRCYKPLSADQEKPGAQKVCLHSPS